MMIRADGIRSKDSFCRHVAHKAAPGFRLALSSLRLSASVSDPRRPGRRPKTHRGHCGERRLPLVELVHSRLHLLGPSLEPSDDFLVAHRSGCRHHDHVAEPTDFIVKALDLLIDRVGSAGTVRVRVRQADPGPPRPRPPGRVARPAPMPSIAWSDPETSTR